MSNFQFLQNEFSSVFNRTKKAESFVKSDPRTSLIYARMALEELVNWMYVNDDELDEQYDSSLHNLLIQPAFKEQFNNKLYNELFIIKKTGNLAVHNKPVSDIDSHIVIENLFYFTKWFVKSYGREEYKNIGVFDFNLIPEKGERTLSRSEIQQLQKELNENLQHYQNILKEKEEKEKRLAKENELYRKQLAFYKDQLASNKKIANIDDTEHHPRNEVETRKYLIDVALRQAGWDLKGINDKEFPVKYMPLSTNPSGKGFVDYVLWDNDGLPLALIEAKKTIANVRKGENQAQLYADCLEKMYGRRPVMYYSNGYEIYLWDDQFYKKARPVHGFYTKAELQTIMFRRANRKDIRQATIDTNIVDRTYQLRSIRSIAEHFAGNDRRTKKLIGTNRGALLVLATGTGKTRTAIAFSKVLLECAWAKRILFLADRISLVKQAKRNFVKLLPEHTSVNLLEEKDNPDARFAFSTYKTMINLIDGNRDKEARFYGVGHFDLVIIDEAHRSIYKKYRAIFEYFDSLFLGLTATPVNRIDKNTYHVFGLPDKTPTDAFTFDEAVNHQPPYLTPYNSIEVPTQLLKHGIRYDKLSEEEKEQFENEILEGEEATGNEWIPPSELNKWLFNRPTAIETIQFILKHGIKKRGGEELGKTIIFAKNQKHAHFLKDVFLELDKELFGNDYVKVITHSEPKAQEFIDRFCDEEKDRLPQIVISVDMMDTGIDAPSCVNLVFYKPVKSYTKFWQMIGRGSRLRPDLFGPGKDKTHFLIFDLVSNFYFFRENSEGISASSQKSITEIVFGLRLNLAEYLKSNQFKDDQALKQFRKKLLDGLHGEITNLDLNRFDVRMKLKTVNDFGNNNREVWNHLSKKDIGKILNELAPLVKPAKNENDLARFYDKLIYDLMKANLERPDRNEFMESSKVSILKVANTSKNLIKKSTIPEVKSNLDIVKIPLSEEFWKDRGVNHLERIRAGIRNLVKYIDPTEQKYVVTDFKDYIINDEVKTNKTNEETEEIKSPFQNNVYRLEKILRENEHNITVQRIRKGEKITVHELKLLEDILFQNGLDKKEIEEELGSNLDLVSFIKSLMGLNAGKVNEAFAKFINDYKLNPTQIEFLNTIKIFFTKNGKIEPSKLYERPFKNFHNMGIDGVFTESQADIIFQIVKDLNQAN